jgi:serine phosphatase RsbU (regulator of sigma subunit)/pSer/pThr/pTyr-binding forkhead associated (FHA) protein
MASNRLNPSTIAGAAATPLTLVPLNDPSLRPTELPPTRPVLLGRQSQCDLQLADQTVSRAHAVIEQRSGAWYITDKASRLGTLLNGIRLDADSPTPLRDGDIITIARWSFRSRIGAHAATEGTRSTLAGTSRLTDDQQGRVETFKSDALLAKAEQRLQLVMDLAADLHAARDEASLATALVAATSRGTSYGRCAVVKLTPGTDEVTILAARVHGQDTPGGFPFSRTLVRAASGGEIARLTGDTSLQHAMSIVSHGIRSAMCAPVMVGSDVLAYLYLDDDGRGAQSGPEVDAFVAALTRIGSLALAEISRRQLQARHSELAADLTAARTAQVRLMPAPTGRVGPIVYAARNQPGRLVAGDLLDVIDLGEGRVAACLGDVSGKGVGAAMLMSAAQTQLRATLRHESDPARAVELLNREVVSRLLTDGFISLWTGIIDVRTDTLTYVDAGHSYWTIRRAGGTHVAGPTADFLPLGVDADEAYRATTIEFHEGDRLSVFSDGVAEQPGVDGSAFRTQGAIDAMAGATDEIADVDAIFAAMRTHAQAEAFADDVTVLSVRR